MITFSAILITFIALMSVLIAAALIVLAGGSGLLLALGDLIICGLIIVGIVKLFRRRK